MKKADPPEIIDWDETALPRISRRYNNNLLSTLAISGILFNGANNYTCYPRAAQRPQDYSTCSPKHICRPRSY